MKKLEKLTFYILKVMCICGLFAVMNTVGIEIVDWQWWMVALIMAFYTVILTLDFTGREDEK